MFKVLPSLAASEAFVALSASALAHEEHPDPRDDETEPRDGQDGHHREPEHVPRHDHGGHRSSLGVSAGPVYIPSESEYTLSLHGHFLFEIGQGPFGIGLGYERLLDDHAHSSINTILQYRITDPWSVSLSLGITFEGSEIDSPRPSAHLETVYEFPLGPIDLGPAFEVAVEPEGVHLTLALHAGMHF